MQRLPQHRVPPTSAPFRSDGPSVLSPRLARDGRSARRLSARSMPWVSVRWFEERVILRPPQGRVLDTHQAPHRRSRADLRQAGTVVLPARSRERACCALRMPMPWSWSTKLSVVLSAALFGLLGPVSAAERQTVCTITVNSADEKEAFRRHLPESKYKFVELVERGRPDWLASACRAQVSLRRARRLRPLRRRQRVLFGSPGGERIPAGRPNWSASRAAAPARRCSPA